MLPAPALQWLPASHLSSDLNSSLMLAEERTSSLNLCCLSTCHHCVAGECGQLVVSEQQRRYLLMQPGSAPYNENFW